MRKIACCILTVLWVPLAVQAQKRPLDLDEAIRLGLQASPALRASAARAEASAAKTREVAAARLPSLKLGAGYARLSEVPPFEVTLPISPDPIVVSQSYFDNWTLRASVQQPLFTGFRLEAGADAARLLERSAGLDLDKVRSDFLFAVKSAYWGLARAREAEAVVAENIAQVREHLKDVKAFFDQGLLTRNEVLRAEVQLANVELLAVDARNAVEVAQTLLNSLIGLPLATDLELTTSPESRAGLTPAETPPPEEAEAASLVKTALANRPELKSADLRIQASAAAVRAAKSGRYPQVFLAGNYHYLRPNPRLMPARDRFYGTWDVGVSISFDVWNWGQTRSLTDQARAELAQARETRKLLEDQTVLEVTQSRLALAQAREKARVAAQAVGQAEENLRMARERFRQGVALNADVLDAEVLLLQAKMSRTQASIDFVLAQARLEKALGQ